MHGEDAELRWSGAAAGGRGAAKRCRGNIESGAALAGPGLG